MFIGGEGWFRNKRECEDFARDQILEGKFQWFIDIVIYLKFVTGEAVSTVESQRDEMNALKFRKKNDQSIVIPAFKTNIPPILGRIVEDKESFTPLTEIRKPELWNAHDGVRRVYPRDSKYIHDQIIKLHAGINR